MNVLLSISNETMVARLMQVVAKRIHPSIIIFGLMGWCISPLVANEAVSSALAKLPIRLEATQAEGGTVVQTGDGKPAVLFQAAAPVKERIIWRIAPLLPPGGWRVDIDFYRPSNTSCSPDQEVLFEGEGGSALGNMNLYYLGIAEGHFRRSCYFYSDKPLAALGLQKSGQRNLDTAAVTSITVSPANLASVKEEPVVYHLAVNGDQVKLPAEMSHGVYVMNMEPPVALRWKFGDGRSFDTPARKELRVFLDQPATMTVLQGGSFTEFKATCYTTTASPSFTVEGSPSLLVDAVPGKFETHTLLLKGYRGSAAPQMDLLPEGKKLAVVTSWDDGRLADLTVAGMLKKYGMKGTFYMNRKSEMIGHLQELEALGMEVGSHSWNHPFLFNSSPKRCLDETVEMRRFLEKELGHPVISFAYPFYFMSAYDVDGDYVMRAVRQAGYWSARNSTTGDNRIDAIPEPLAMKSNFHFKAGSAKVKAKLDELLNTPGAILYFWGHSYELAAGDGAKILEDDLACVAHREDTWYTTIGELMAWKLMREGLCIDAAKPTPEGMLFTLKLPWFHQYLRQVPVSLLLPDGVSSVSWDGQAVPLTNGRVQLKW